MCEIALRTLGPQGSFTVCWSGTFKPLSRNSLVLIFLSADPLRSLGHSPGEVPAEALGRSRPGGWEEPATQKPDPPPHPSQNKFKQTTNNGENNDSNSTDTREKSNSNHRQTPES